MIHIPSSSSFQRFSFQNFSFYLHVFPHRQHPQQKPGADPGTTAEGANEARSRH